MQDTNITTTEVIEPTPAIKKSNKLILGLIITFLFLCIIIAILLVIYFSNKATGDVNTTPTPSSTLTLSITVSATEAEKTTLTPTPTKTIIGTAIPTATQGPIATLTKSYSEEVLPWVYTFKYYSNWNEINKIKYQNTLSIGFGAGTNLGCVEGESICSMVLNIGIPAEILDSANVAKLGAENIIIDSQGVTELSYYKYNSNDKHFLYLPTVNGFFIVNVAPDKDTEAISLFKEILKTFSYEESPNAL